MRQPGARGALLVGALGSFLLVAPTPAVSAAALRSPHGTEPLVGVAGLMGWTLAAWLLLLTSLTLLAHLPARGLSRPLVAGARDAARLVAPRSVRTTVAVLIGGTLALGSPGLAAAGAVPQRSPAVTDALPPSLDWPREAAQPPAAAGPDVTALARTGPSTQPLPTAVPREATPAVTVAPGASLWQIAQQRLGPAASAAEIAREWPRWWQANRALIGDAPDLIRPGMQLTPP